MIERWKPSKQIMACIATILFILFYNRAGITLEMLLLMIFGVVLILLVHFHRRERQNIAEIAEKRGEYKNAVLADAIIMFEANLTKNRYEQGVSEAPF